MVDSIYEHPFDQFQRYQLLADVVTVLERDRPPLSVIEVGGWPPKVGQGVGAGGGAPVFTHLDALADGADVPGPARRGGGEPRPCATSARVHEYETHEGLSNLGRCHGVTAPVRVGRL